MRSLSRRRFLELSIVTACCGGSIGCGTVLYPERRGQPSGRLDWGVVALDAVGLVFFFVPGVIAFAVDFATGAIYLPPDGYGRNQRMHSSEPLVTLHAPGPRPTVRELEDVVSQHARQEVRLVPGTYRTRELSSISEFWQAADALAEVG